MLVLDHDLLDTVLRNIKEAARADTGGVNSRVSFPVWLHVYDLGLVTKIVTNNWIMRSNGLGAFHSGIEVLGAEWSFQGSSAPEKSIDDQAETVVEAESGEERTGLMCHHPKVHPVHSYRESVFLGETPLRVAEIWKLLLRMEREWLSKTYHVVHRNCTDFAEEFARELRVPEPIPEWVHGIAKSTLKHTPLAMVDGNFLPRSSQGSVGSLASAGSQSVSGTALEDTSKEIEALERGQASETGGHRNDASGAFHHPGARLSKESVREKERIASKSGDPSRSPKESEQLVTSRESTDGGDTNGAEPPERSRVTQVRRWNNSARLRSSTAGPKDLATAVLE